MGDVSVANGMSQVQKLNVARSITLASGWVCSCVGCEHAQHIGGKQQSSLNCHCCDGAWWHEERLSLTGRNGI